MLSAVTTPGGVREDVRVARDAYALDIGDTVNGSNRLSRRPASKLAARRLRSGAISSRLRRAEIWAKLLLWMPAALDAGLVTMTK